MSFPSAANFRLEIPFYGKFSEDGFNSYDDDSSKLKMVNKAV